MYERPDLNERDLSFSAFHVFLRHRTALRNIVMSVSHAYTYFDKYCYQFCKLCQCNWLYLVSIDDSDTDVFFFISWTLRGHKRINFPYIHFLHATMLLLHLRCPDARHHGFILICILTYNVRVGCLFLCER